MAAARGQPPVQWWEAGGSGPHKVSTGAAPLLSAMTSLVQGNTDCKYVAKWTGSFASLSASNLSRRAATLIGRDKQLPSQGEHRSFCYVVCITCLSEGGSDPHKMGCTVALCNSCQCGCTVVCNKQQLTCNKGGALSLRSGGQQP